MKIIPLEFRIRDSVVIGAVVMSPYVICFNEVVRTYCSLVAERERSVADYIYYRSPEAE